VRSRFPVLPKGEGLVSALRIAEGECALCGDDLLAYTDKGTIHRYESQCLGDVGFVANIDKSFCSHTGGVFAELSFTVRGGYRYEPEPFPPLGQEPKDHEVRIIHSVDPIGDIPAKVLTTPIGRGQALDVGPALTASLQCVPPALRQVVCSRMKRAVGIECPGLVTALLRKGIDPGAPRGLGGAELPWCKVSLTSTRRVASVLASRNILRGALKNRDFSLLKAADLGGAWTVNQHRPMTDLADQMAGGDFPPSSVGLSEPVPGIVADVLTCHAGRYEELMRSASAAHYRALQSMGVIPLQGPTSIAEIGLGRIGKMVSERRNQIIRSYPNAPLSSNVVGSLQRWTSSLDSLVCGPYHPSQSVTRIRRGRRNRIYRVEPHCAHPDLAANDHNLRLFFAQVEPVTLSLLPRRHPIFGGAGP